MRNSATTPNANANVQKYDRSYGAKYEPFNFDLKTHAVLKGASGPDPRAILAAQVECEETTNRNGQPYMQKKVVCFHEDAHGGFSGQYIFLKLRSDSPLQHGQWLDPTKLVVAEMQQGEVSFNGIYLVEEGRTFTEKDKKPALTGQTIVPAIINESEVNPLVVGGATQNA